MTPVIGAMHRLPCFVTQSCEVSDSGPSAREFTSLQLWPWCRALWLWNHIWVPNSERPVCAASFSLIAIPGNRPQSRPQILKPNLYSKFWRANFSGQLFSGSHTGLRVLFKLALQGILFTWVRNTPSLESSWEKAAWSVSPVPSGKGHLDSTETAGQWGSSRSHWTHQDPAGLALFLNTFWI